jgi:hypothetical protein
MYQLFQADFVYRQCTYKALATVSSGRGDSVVLIYLHDPLLQEQFPGGNLTINLARGLDLCGEELSGKQELLLAVLTAFRGLQRFPVVRLNFVQAAIPFIHPTFKRGPLRLLMYVDKKLMDSLLLPVAALSDSEEDTLYIRQAMRTLIDKWEDYLHGRSLELEFKLQLDH